MYFLSTIDTLSYLCMSFVLVTELTKGALKLLQAYFAMYSAENGCLVPAPIVICLYVACLNTLPTAQPKCSIEC